jgi:hypothetical protein
MVPKIEFWKPKNFLDAWDIVSMMTALLNKKLKKNAQEIKVIYF